ncbi:MAG: hypothetical protein ACRD3E_08730 [Terriglobales bacterium]
MQFRTAIVALLLAGAAIAQQKPDAKHTAPAKPAAAPASSQCPLPKTDENHAQIYRIVMKDGSFQPATKCELLDRGERVHYFSSERNEWEDVPNSLVDWAATTKALTEAPVVTASASNDAAAADADEQAERKEEEARSPEIQPGLRVPDQGGVFLLDYWRDEPELVELVQNGGDVNKNTGRNILRAAINPIAKSKQTIELKGGHARVQSHVPQPAIYIDIDADQNPETGASAKDMSQSQHFRIVRADEKKDSRVVGVIEVAVYGAVSQKAKYIETKSEVVSPQWVKITPAVPLDPGEYAVVEMLGKDINLYVWDFGVHPTAAQNAKPWRPAPVTDTSTGTKESPVLNPRPKKP